MTTELVDEFRRVINITINACARDAYYEYTDKGFKAAKESNEKALAARQAFIQKLEALP